MQNILEVRVGLLNDTCLTNHKNSIRRVHGLHHLRTNNIRHDTLTIK